jgi:hypothetical protein
MTRDGDLSLPRLDKASPQQAETLNCRPSIATGLFTLLRI